jgi:energy-coupling factor transporter ATP-binding protein EcfA2
VSAERSALRMPYPGLRPFEAEDQAVFFGREAQIGAMLRQLEDHRFVAVVGSSGSGKSSLVRAGLLPAVKEGFLLSSAAWATLILRPGHQPYVRLACRLQALSQSGKESPGPSESGLVQLLRRTDRGLLAALAAADVPEGTNVMVVVDQFEELFAFRRPNASRDEVTSRDEAAAFVRMLLRACSEPKGRVWVVLTLRSDFIGDCEAFLGLPEAVSRSQFLVPRLDRGQMEEAIRRPGEVKGAIYRPFTFEEGLVNRMINDAGDRPDQLPLLQHALMCTWKQAVQKAEARGDLVQLKVEDYEDKAVGGIERALSLHADAAWRTIEKDSRKALLARRLFLLLCDVSPEGQITRRRPRVREIQAATGGTVAEIEQVVRLFQEDDRNFLLPPQSEQLSADSALDVSHEALLRQWDTYRKWQDEERVQVAELRRLVEQAHLHKAGKGGPLTAEDLPRIAVWEKEATWQWAMRYVRKDDWDQVLTFVDESRRKIERHAKRQRATVLATGLVLMLATVVSIVQMVRANRVATEKGEAERRANLAATNAVAQQKRAEAATAAANEALTKNFARTIGFSDSRALLPEEIGTVWELAELPEANEIVRENVLEAWFQADGSLARVLMRDGAALRAATGISVKRQSWVPPLADALAKRILTEPADSASRWRNPQLGSARLASDQEVWAFLSEIISPETAAASAPQLLEKLEGIPKLDLFRQRGWEETLAAVVAKIADKQLATNLAGRGTELLLGGIEDEGALPDYQLESALAAFTKLTRCLDERAADQALARAETALIARIEHTPRGLYALSQLLRELPAFRDTNLVATAALRCGEITLDRLNSATNFSEKMNQTETLAALASRMERETGEKLAVRATEAIITAMAIETNNLYGWRGSNVLSALAGQMQPQRAALQMERLTQLLTGPPVTNDSILGDALAAFSTHGTPEAAGACGRRLLTLMLATNELDYSRELAVGHALDALAATMTQADLTAASELCATAIREASTTGAYRAMTPARHLPRLASLIKDKAAAADVAAHGSAALVGAMEAGPRSGFYLSGLGEALASLLGGIAAGPAAATLAVRGGAVFAEEMSSTNNQYWLPAMGTALAHIAAQSGGQAGTQAAKGAEVILQTLEAMATPATPQTENVSILAPSRGGLEKALALLTAQAEPGAAASLALRGAQLELRAMRTGTNPYRLADQGITLADLTKTMAPQAAGKAAAEGLLLLLSKEQDSKVPKESFSYDQPKQSTAIALAALAARVAAAKQSQRWAVYQLLLNWSSDASRAEGDNRDPGKSLAELGAAFTPPELAEILKWPFCVGEPERILLSQLEHKTKRQFDGDLRKFAEQAASLGLQDLDAPARRPRVEDALSELQALVPSAVKKP